MPCDADARSQCMNEMDGLTGRRQNQVEHVNWIDRKNNAYPTKIMICICSCIVMWAAHHRQHFTIDVASIRIRACDAHHYLSHSGDVLAYTSVQITAGTKSAHAHVSCSNLCVSLGMTLSIVNESRGYDTRMADVLWQTGALMCSSGYRDEDGDACDDCVRTRV